jgi:hypothetical protein
MWQDKLVWAKDQHYMWQRHKVVLDTGGDRHPDFNKKQRTKL